MRWQRTLARGAGCLLAGVLCHAWAQPKQEALYEDRIMEGLLPEVSPSEPGTGVAHDPTGWPRYVRLEGRWGQQALGGPAGSSLGLAGYGLLETPNHGAISLDVASGAGGFGGWTLRQQALPLAGGWAADHALGWINLDTPDLTRQPGRIFLPSTSVQGLSGRWQRLDQSLQWTAGTGRPARIAMLPQATLEQLPGRLQQIGVQWRPGREATQGPSLPGTTLAWLREQGQGLSVGQGPLVDARSDLWALRHETSHTRVQAQWIRTSQQGLQGTRDGFWIDGLWQLGSTQHGAGAYRLPPGLNWVGRAMPADLMGVYGRSRWHTRQWSVEGSLDLLTSVSGQQASGQYATAGASWRLSRDHRLSTGLSWRDHAGQAWQVHADWRWRNRWGESSWRLELDGGKGQDKTQRWTQDQAWTMPVGWSLSTRLGLIRTAADADMGAAQDTRWVIATNVSAPLGQRIRWRANLELERGRWGHRRSATNLGVEGRLGKGWSWEGSWVSTRGRADEVRSLDPLAPVALSSSPFDSNTFYLVLRHEFEAGTRATPLGGRASEGGGSVEGEVFFDANRNGVRDAGEAGVPQATVFLNQRYGVRTDDQGRFAFPFVATGRHTLALRNESLPLPWTVVGEGRVDVDVRLRERTRWVLPVQRID